MNSRISAAIAAALLLGVPAALGQAPKGASDILPPARRQAAVETAARLTRPPVPAPVPSDLRNPFNPPEFNAVPESQRPAEAARAGQAPNAASAAPVREAPGASDRELLETLAARIPTSGTMIVGGKPLLIVGKNRLEVGTDLTVTYNGQDYELKLVAIDRTTFTLRYRGEEITRPIRSVK